jgi:hypothetical protein
MWAYPNMIPLAPPALLRIWQAIKPFDFQATFGGFPGQNVRREGLKDEVLESMKIFLRRGGWTDVEIFKESE